MKKKTNVSEQASTETVSLYQTARQRYLNYALSVITSRALPDVRDGLKPVQRRILYGMQEMHLTHEAKYQKSAQVVGQVMGRYHPHGDSAIYEAMVRLSQPFAMRYPFVDGQGNFGSIDGDSAAAMRYTEARLQPVAAAMLEDLNEHIVEFQPNYSGTFREPTVLPAAVPALLINGSMGIAVGMATNVPPHNLSEAVRGCIAVIDDPEITLEELMKFIPAPDFPTGGRILTKHDDIRKVYEKGHGAIDIQGEYHVEQEGRRTRIIVTSIPYTVNKQQLQKTIKDLINTNKLPLLTNIHDESAEDVRLVLDVRQGADPEAVMAYLFRHTAMQTRFNVNMTCIIPGETGAPHDKFVPQLVYQPRRLGLREIIDHFLNFRLEVIKNRLSWQLSQLLDRIHILEGLRKLFDGLDEAISIIRGAEDRQDASEKLCARFELDDIQAGAILDLRLYRLARLEIDKIITELTAKTKEANHIRGILASEKRLWKTVREELVYAGKTYGDERRTKLEGYDLSKEYAPENYIIDEDCFVIITKSGLFKRQKSFTDVASIRTKDFDSVSFVRYGSTRCPLILLSSFGKAYTMLVDNVPATAGHGSPLPTVFNLEDGEQIIAAFIDDPRYLCPARPREEQRSLLDILEPPAAAPDERCIVSITHRGQAARLPLAAFSAVSTATGRTFMRLNEGDTVIHAGIARDEGYVSCIADNTRAIVFPIADIPMLKTAGKGVRALALDPGSAIAAARTVTTDNDGVRVRLSDRRELTISVRRLTRGQRGTKGRLLVRRGTVTEIIENDDNVDNGPQAAADDS